MGGSDAKRSCHILAAANAGGVYPKSISPQDHHNWYLGKKKKTLPIWLGLTFPMWRSVLCKIYVPSQYSPGLLDEVNSSPVKSKPFPNASPGPDLTSNSVHRDPGVTWEFACVPLPRW